MDNKTNYEQGRLDMLTELLKYKTSVVANYNELITVIDLTKARKNVKELKDVLPDS